MTTEFGYDLGAFHAADFMQLDNVQPLSAQQTTNNDNLCLPSFSQDSD